MPGPLTALLPALLASGPASPTPYVGVQYAALGARFVGDLTQRTELAHSVQIKTLFIDGDDWPLRAYLAIDTVWTSTRHDGTRFPYPAGAELSVLGFLFIPHLCWRPSAPVQVCGGLGQGTVNVNAEGHRRDWGTWNYQLQVDVPLGQYASVFALGKSVGEVEQEVDGAPAAFTVLMLGGGVGGQF